MQSAPRRGCGRVYTGLCFRGEPGTERVASPLPLQPLSKTELRLSNKRALLLLPHAELGSEPCSRSQTLPGGGEVPMCVQTSSLPMWASAPFSCITGLGKRAAGASPLGPFLLPLPTCRILPCSSPAAGCPQGASADASKVGKHTARSPPRLLGSARVLTGANPSVLSLERRVCLFPYRCLSVNKGLAWLDPWQGRIQQARSRG